MASPIREELDTFRTRPARVSWKIPAFCCNDWGALRLLQMCEKYGVARPFDIVYGAPYCSWAGGRPSAVTKTLSEKEIDAYFSAYSEYGVRCALTLSRLAVDEKQYSDPYCNLLLEYIERYNGEAILFDDGLARYIRKTHPNVKLIASLNKAMCDLKPDFEAEVEYYRELLTLYDEIVIRCETALDQNRLVELADIRKRTEIIVNQFCVPDCKNVFRHLKSLEEWNDGGCRGAGQPCFSLNMAADIDHRIFANLSISNSQINELCERGFTKMKLAGRNARLPQFLDMLATYIFEPTGVISHMKSALLREFKQKAMQGSSGFSQCSLP